MRAARVSRTKSRYLHFIKVMTSITIKIRAESFVVTKVRLEIFSENIYFTKKHENSIIHCRALIWLHLIGEPTWIISSRRKNYLMNMSNLSCSKSSRHEICPFCWNHSLGSEVWLMKICSTRSWILVWQNRGQWNLLRFLKWLLSRINLWYI